MIPAPPTFPFSVPPPPRRHTRTQAHTQAHTHKHTHAHTHIHIPPHTHASTHTHRDRERDTHTKHTHTDRERHTHAHTHARTHTHRDRQRHARAHAQKVLDFSTLGQKLTFIIYSISIVHLPSCIQCTILPQTQGRQPLLLQDMFEVTIATVALRSSHFSFLSAVGLEPAVLQIWVTPREKHVERPMTHS